MQIMLTALKEISKEFIFPHPLCSRNPHDDAGKNQTLAKNFMKSTQLTVIMRHSSYSLHYETRAIIDRMSATAAQH